MSDSNGEHEDDMDGEISITFSLREDDIKRLGLSLEDCETALMDALEAQEELQADDAPAFQEIKLNVAGREIRLGDIADVEMTSEWEDIEDVEFDDDEVETEMLFDDEEEGEPEA